MTRESPKATGVRAKSRFHATLASIMQLVLVQNPVIVNQGYEWKDILGAQYHFPNQYKNRCAPGTHSCTIAERGGQVENGPNRSTSGPAGSTTTFGVTRQSH